MGVWLFYHNARCNDYWRDDHCHADQLARAAPARHIRFTPCNICFTMATRAMGAGCVAMANLVPPGQSCIDVILIMLAILPPDARELSARHAARRRGHVSSCPHDIFILIFWIDRLPVSMLGSLIMSRVLLLQLDGKIPNGIIHLTDPVLSLMIRP
jgi:hypothetical protein